jgi:hypothetical protein
MEVEFHDGKTYLYKADTAAYTKLKTAKSIGQQFGVQFGKEKGLPSNVPAIAYEANKKPRVKPKGPER